MSRSLTVCVFCASSDRIAPHYVQLASDVGAELARRGHHLVTGGGSVSCMGAVAAAARAGGARTVGVIPQALLDAEVADHDADELVVTVDMRTRKGEMDARADAFLTLPGGLGTLEEVLEVWTAATLRMHHKPVVVCDPDDLFAPLRAQVDRLVDRGFARASVREHLVWTSSATEALDAVERLAGAAPAPGAGEGRGAAAPGAGVPDDEVLEAEP